MPYTPPSKSAASSPPHGPPNATRRNSEPVLRGTLPRSSSYLTKHRRTPSAVGLPEQINGSTNTPTPPGTSDDLKSMAGTGSIRQSPPPITGPRGMPSGAVISPPDSLSGSDDEGLEMRGRKLPNLKALKDAVNSIPLRRESSPVNKPAPVVAVVEQLLSEPVTFVEGMHHSYSTGALDALGSRRSSQAVPGIECSAIHINGSLTPSEEDSEDEKRVKPPMVRKKSGELVRPALRPASRRRPSSMPGTPTFSKAVHFDAHLEHVRHFLQVDRPLAVSAGSSPVDILESDTEYPFPPSDDERSRQTRSPPYEWEIITSNFPVDDLARTALPARVERLWLSKDCRFLHGWISVANLAFHKCLTCRFTLDYWKTTSEVAAEYIGQIHATGHDRWSFSIRLSDMANLETKTLYLCVRYNVNGQEYWDNNGGANFQVDFHKKFLPQSGKRGSHGVGSRPAGELPRSNRRSNPNTSTRPKSMPVGLSTHLIDQARRTLDKSRDDFLDSNGPIRLKKSTSDFRGNSAGARSSNAFGRRYDFNASLNEAKQSARTKDSKDSKKVNSVAPALSTIPSRPPIPHSDHHDSPNKKDYTYDEIVNRFCFYGSKQIQRTAQPTAPKVPPGRFDGGDESANDAPRNYHHVSTTPERGTGALNHTQPVAANTSVFALSSSPRSDFLVSDGIMASSLRAGSPISNFSPRAGTSPASLAHHAQRHNRFPFSAETHAATAIHG
ncbi:hypothetical protein jhhlp_002144 [Lomentospora prolificans]|uniref:CBM21 domain-containing protein n=1 Tax=Lomentospora prolificans TaxID=41688 RepID=A0A2N3ND96_9PEZI|nr:hypothetical protein jhhlp_002144 [Lomentospora prolificans]